MTTHNGEPLHARVRRLERELHEITSSRSWRWTRALRDAASRVRTALGTEPGFAPPPAPGQDGNRATGGLLIGKQAFSDLADVVLQSFLSSGAPLKIPSSDTPSVSIVVVVWNRAELTFQCLRSIAEVDDIDFELIVVDNGSADQTPELFQRIQGVRYVRNGENRFFSPAVNQGAGDARGEFLLLLNNDAILMPGAVRILVDAVRSSADVGAAGGKIVLLDGSLQEAGNIVWRDGSCLGYGRGDSPLASPYMFRRDVDYCSGALLVTRRRLFEQLGGLDEVFNPAYYEETDYCIRLREANYRVVYEPRSVILHYEFASSSPEGAIDLQVRNRATFVQRHHDRLRSHMAPDPENVLEARSADRSRRRVLYIDDRVPHRHLGSGFPRANAIVRKLSEWGFAVTFYPVSITWEEWDKVYRSVPNDVEVILDSGEAGMGRFFLSRRGYYDLVFVSRPHNMRTLREFTDADPGLLEGIDLVYDAEAVFAFREVQQMELDGRNASGELEKRTRAEVELARVAHTVVSVSEREAQVFRSHGIPRVEVLGHVHDRTPTPRPFGERAGFLFVGAIHDTTSPNGDSMTWFVREILPGIQAEDPDAGVSIIGVVSSEEILALESPAVRVLGPVEDLFDFYDSARVFIAPTRFSAGIPHKITEAAAHGIPVVATSTLAAQLDWTDGRELLVADTAPDFARQCVRLSSDQSLWETMRRNALDRVVDDYSNRVFEDALRRIAGDARRVRDHSRTSH
jgi:GT2 family glycosyltransferase